MLCDGLRASKADPTDLAARLRCQIGMWTAVSNIGRVPFGASHAIGHILGSAAGVPHGHTSCVLLPAVLEYNKGTNAAQQREVAGVFGDRSVPASEHVRRLVRDLGCPCWLEDVGVGEGRHAEIAEKSMSDPWIPTNPRRITATAQVREILRLASTPTAATSRL